MAAIERLTSMTPPIRVLAQKIDNVVVNTTVEAAQFILAAAIQSGFSEVLLKRLDINVFLAVGVCEGFPLSVIRFVAGKQNTYDLGKWNSLRRYTGSPIVYFRNEHWQIAEFIIGEHRTWQDEDAVDLALERLVMIQSLPVENIALPVGLANPRSHLVSLCDVMMKGLESGSKDYANIEYIESHATELLPEKEEDLVLTHRDYSMSNLLFNYSDVAGCRVVDWTVGRCPRYVDLAMFLIYIYNVDKARYRQKLNGFLDSGGWVGFTERSMCSYLLLASLVHAESALVNSSSRPLQTLLQGVGDLLHDWQ